MGFLIFLSEFALILPRLSRVSTSVHPHEEDNLSVPNFLLVMLKLKKLVSQLQLLLLSHFSRVRLLVTPWTAAHQAPLSMGFSGQEYSTYIDAIINMHAISLLEK